MTTLANPLPVVAIDDDANRWARVTTLAWLLEINRANLDDETDCWRTLFREGVGPGEAMQLTPDAIRHAREIAQGAAQWTR